MDGEGSEGEGRREGKRERGRGGGRRQQCWGRRLGGVGLETAGGEGSRRR